MSVDLTPDEQTMLAGILDKELDVLRDEIFKTDTRDYKDQLKAREQILRGLMAKVNAATA